MKRKIYFCSMNRAAHLPLVWGNLRAYAESDPRIRDHYQFEAPFFMLEQQARVLEETKDPFLFLISCYVWNYNKNLELSRRIKEKYPNVLILAGGPHVPNAPAKMFESAPFLDFAIHNEGEIPLAQTLLALLEHTPDFSDISSLSYRSGDRIVTNPIKAKLPDKIDFASPYLAGYFEDAIVQARNLGHHPIALWETNRGCPYSCTFCDWGSANMSKLRRFSVERLEAEIDYFADKQIQSVLCADANFGILKRDVELAARLVERKNTVGYPEKFVTNYAKNATDRIFEISRRFVDAGMAHGAILAMQSTDDTTLKAVRRSNIPFEGYRRLSDKFHGAGIRAYTEIILGLPQETEQSFTKGLCKVLEAGIHDDIMIYECVVLPNSQMGDPLYRQLHQLKTIVRPFLPDDVESLEVVVGHSAMDSQAWVRTYVFGMLVCALHNLDLTQYLSRYAHQEGVADFERFYRALFDGAMRHEDSWLGAAAHRVTRLLKDYLVDDQISNDNRIYSQPDMVAVARETIPDKVDWLLHEWLWAAVVRDPARLYEDIERFLTEAGVNLDARMKSLIEYQRDTIVTLDYDPLAGKVGIYDYDWPTFFASGMSDLQEKLTITQFMGPPVQKRPGQTPYGNRVESAG